ncbi:ABC transporter substrate-binding protein [uncultured Nitratireductor sp.]|uniref:ABC transporter substrate-binding protein n=1 Tax=uncultured Nitratireductor sp. TaxID=520953 RepID=UPI0025DA4092|nr:ABC transporter substrate-binding protein [uncultured Nitratireductor sp.]
MGLLKQPQISRKMGAIAAGALATAAVVSPLNAAFCEEKPKPGGSVNIALTTDIQGVDPGVKRDSNTDAVMNHVVEGLVAYKEDGTVGLLGAKALDVSEDGLVHTFTLRDEWTFHNGEPVTSEEVKWSWERMLAEETGWRCRSWYVEGGDVVIDGIEAPDPQTVVFTLDKPSAVFLPKMANHQCIGAILHPDSVADDGSFVNPIGTGPYRLNEWKQGEYVRLERFEDYVPNQAPTSGFAGDRTAYIDTVTFLVVPDASVAKAALLAGDVQLAREFTPNDLDELKANADLDVYTSETFGWKVLLFNRKDGLFADAAMRRAIARAIDIDQIAAIMTNGVSTGNPSAVPKLSAYHTPVQDEGPGFDPTGAKKAAEEAGYNGQTLKIMTNRRFQDEYDASLIVQQQLKQAGFDAELEVVEWATQLDAYYEGGYQMMLFGYSPRTDPYLSFELVSDTNQESAKAHEIVDDAFTALLEKAATTVDPDQRQDHIDALHEVLVKDLPGVSLYNPIVVSAGATALEGYAEFGVGHPRLWGAWLSE